VDWQHGEHRRYIFIPRPEKEKKKYGEGEEKRNKVISVPRAITSAGKKKKKTSTLAGGVNGRRGAHLSAAHHRSLRRGGGMKGAIRQAASARWRHVAAASAIARIESMAAESVNGSANRNGAKKRKHAAAA